MSAQATTYDIHLRASIARISCRIPCTTGPRPKVAEAIWSNLQHAVRSSVPYLKHAAAPTSPAEAQKMDPPKTCRAFENITPRILKVVSMEQGNRKEKEEEKNTGTPGIAWNNRISKF